MSREETSPQVSLEHGEQGEAKWNMRGNMRGNMKGMQSGHEVEQGGAKWNMKFEQEGATVYITGKTP